MINDATTNTEIKYIRGDIHETALARIATLEAQLGIAREALEKIPMHAGHPNAAEGCRIIIKVAREALAAMDTSGERVAQWKIAEVDREEG